MKTADNKHHPGYMELIEDLTTKFPLSEPRIEGEQTQKDFIALFGAVLRMRNILLSFDDFKDMGILTERELQDYLARYQDLRDEWLSAGRKATQSILMTISSLKRNLSGKSKSISIIS